MASDYNRIAKNFNNNIRYLFGLFLHNNWPNIISRWLHNPFGDKTKNEQYNWCHKMWMERNKYTGNFACTTGLYVNGLDIVYIFVQCLYKIGLIVLMIMSSSKYSHVRNLNQLSQGVATVCVSLCPPATWGNGLVWQSTAFYSDSARWASAPSSISLISTSLGDRFFAASSA